MAELETRFDIAHQDTEGRMDNVADWKFLQLHREPGHPACMSGLDCVMIQMDKEKVGSISKQEDK